MKWVSWPKNSRFRFFEGILIITMSDASVINVMMIIFEYSSISAVQAVKAVALTNADMMTSNLGANICYRNAGVGEGSVLDHGGCT